MPDSRRSYGLADSTPHVQGVPRVVGKSTIAMPCPHCGCRDLYDIEVDIVLALLVGGKGIGKYIGCPACSFASPMLTEATGETPRG
jgi:hypothetical protein